MSDVVLVHGGSRDEGVWDAVSPNLEAAGHSVIAPTLEDADVSSLEAHIQTVCGSIRSNDLTDVVLVSHSYGAFPATGASTRVPDRIQQLVYLDTGYPQVGKSLFDRASDAGLDFPSYGADPDPPFVAPLEFDTELWMRFPKVYVRALENQFKPITQISRQLVMEHKDDSNWTYREIDSPHNMMLEKPDETAALLVDVIPLSQSGARDRSVVGLSEVASDPPISAPRSRQSTSIDRFRPSGVMGR